VRDILCSCDHDADQHCQVEGCLYRNQRTMEWCQCNKPPAAVLLKVALRTIRGMIASLRADDATFALNDGAAQLAELERACGGGRG
jgi:hypothetical protein